MVGLSNRLMEIGLTIGINHSSDGKGFNPSEMQCNEALNWHTKIHAKNSFQTPQIAAAVSKQKSKEFFQ